MNLPKSPVTADPKDLQKWAEQITAFLRSPEFQLVRTIGGQEKTFEMKVGDITGSSYFLVQSDGTVSIIGTADRLWTAVGGLYEHNTPLTFVWAGGEANVWKDVIGLTAGGNPTRMTENGATGELTIIDAGKYIVGYAISASANAGLELHSQLAVDSGAGYVRSPKIAFRRTIGAGNNFASGSAGPFHLDFDVGDKIKVQMQSDTASRTLTIDHLQLCCHRAAE